MTKKDLIDQILVAVRNEPAEIKAMVQKLIDPATNFVLGRHQWDMRRATTTIVAKASDPEVKFPTDCDKPIKLFHAGMTKPVDYITPEEYAERLALASTSGVTEGRDYTIEGDGLGNMVFKFWPPFAADTNVTLHYSRILPVNIFEKLNEFFLNAIRVEVEYRLAELFAKQGEWSNYGALLKARDQGFNDLVSYYAGHTGRMTVARLDEIQRNTSQYLHR